MCSEFMENHQGDLTDMLRGYAGDWQFVCNPGNYQSAPVQEFGHDPYTQIWDPILHDMGVDSSSHDGVFGGVVSDDYKFFEQEEMKIRPSNIFSRMLQISPTEKLQLPPIAAAAAAADQRGLISSPNSFKRSFVESPAGVQISSPRNTGIKRRKSQANKVVCIPAAAPANSSGRPSGEVVPSDHWAWRKYGQKPIKGSPYPRGYYRCSSLKGCSARKQVERSRTDPNMLVITYSSEHSHPWPTQRNALAGSTRTHQPNKTTPTSKNQQKHTDPKLEPKETSAGNPKVDPNPTVVKEEKDKDSDVNDDGGFRHSYKPVFLESLNQSEDGFFEDLGEIEPDPLDLLLFSGGDDPDSKPLDPFTFYDWAGTNSGNTISTTSASAAAAETFGEPKRDSLNMHASVREISRGLK